ncbi:sensor histidine kinase [Cognatilysobacter segetis]|uniref:sensor histidine kinase n=1 Tax=Cognatilysobacter segetis TaxID=2492394 RepID=UPI0013901DAE|nr:histidine kinase dimerization/phospho-acceptor domain-containing protein [Lysobacter segetis]
MSERPLFERLVHDLKGPLSPLQTAAYLLRRPELPEERRVELAETIERQSRRMAGMIEELGDWVRAQEGRLVHRLRPVEVQMLLDLAVGGVPGCATEPQLAPELDGAHVEGDEARLVQALGSLLAFAQSRAGTAAPGLHAWRDGAQVLIEVSDGGESPDNAAALLVDPLPEPFDLGLGLRLVVAGAIARAHGGMLDAHALAPGLAFRLALPLAA